MILVLGTGRCGSSAVAASLERIGIDMGGPGIVKDATPEGDHEDETFRSLNWALSQGEITKPEYIATLRNYLEGKKEPYGLKHPVASEFPGIVVQALPPRPIIIWVTRDLEDTTESWKKWFPGPDGFAETWVRYRHYTLAAWLWERPHIRIDMTEHVEEAVLDRVLGDALVTWAAKQWD